MNAKLIALLIRSNATLIEAIGELSRQLDTAGNYSENNFWNLRQEVIAMAEEAEAMKVEVNQLITTVTPHGKCEGIMSTFKRVSDTLEGKVTPIIPISPAHQKSDLLSMQATDLKAGICYHGVDGAGIEYYARINGLSDYSDHIEGTDRAVYSVSLLNKDGTDVDHCPRMMHGHLILKEFRHW